MNIILDVIVVAIIAICVFLSAKRGFVRTIVEVVGFVAAILIAINLSAPVSEFIYDKTVSPSIEKTVVAVLDETAGEVSDNIADTIWGKLPEFVSNAAEKSGITKDNLSSELLGGGNNEEIAQSITTDVLAPVITTIIKYIVTLFLFVILLIVVKILARFINSIFKKSLLGGANALLGGVVGAAKGIIYALLFCVLVTLITNVTKDSFFITNEIIDNSTIFKFLLDFVPFKL